ncbi:MAG: arginine--tRNA ligase [Deltaproteobacteria bacterium]|nr:arginine--tRNA ligase [Deltaproteobacteria bacterium]
MREDLEARLLQAVARVVRELAPDAEVDLAAISLVPARSPEHGDYACNAGLVLAKPLRSPPRLLAEKIAAALDAPDVERIEIAGPGFLNLYLALERWHQVVSRVLRAGEAWGRSDASAGETVQVEFVSANPTGPLTIGHGRNAVIGDAVARLFEAVGCKVTREYYFNDGGRQMRVLADSLRARYEQALGREAELPEDGYQGDYLVEIARALADEQGEAWLDAEQDQFKKRAQDAIFADIESTLQRLGISFDVYFNEASLYENGSIDEVLESLRDAGFVYEGEGAVWLDSTHMDLDRDRVLVRSTGEPTYMLPDIAYHRDKVSRGFTRIIDVLGPDHIEQFPYVKAATGALGCDVAGLEVVMYQWVNLRSGGEIVKMSTRKASFITIDEVLDQVGSDVFRYFMVERRADTHLDFDLDLARERSDRNPVYKIQYAHARLCSIERKASERGVTLPPIDDLPLQRLDSPGEIELAKRLGHFPDLVVHAARAREPQEVTRYLLDLATAFHTYISDGRRHRVLSEDADLSHARLALVGAIRTTLANGLALLGISAPERM